MNTSAHVSRRIYGRPDDTRYSDMKSLKADARYSKDNHEVLESDWGDLRVKAVVQDNEDKYILQVRNNTPIELPLNSFALTQMCRLARLRKTDLPRLDLETRQEFFDQLLYDSVIDKDFDPTKQKAKILIENQHDGQAVVRAVVSQAYERVWDIDLLDIVDRWAIGSGFKPAVPTINQWIQEKDGGKPALFRSDRDMYTFFYTDRDNGSNQDFGGLRKGLVVMNSEVGASSLVIDEFIFREVCGNFLIWGMTQREVRMKPHIGEIQLFVDQFEQELKVKSGTIEITQLEWDRIEKASKKQFARTPEEANTRLRKMLDLTVEQALRSVALAQNSEAGAGDLSFWSVANGVTATAKEQPFADQQIELSRKAGKLLNAVA